MNKNLISEMDYKNKNFDPHRIQSEDWARDVTVITEGSDIINFYKDKCVFVTGATGFLGKVLVEKLMRACQSMDTLYILCRDKKGKDIQARLDEIYSGVLFKKLEKIYPGFRKKIVAIKGDVALPNLGISESDRKILTEKVSIIYHVAATVRFDEKIKSAVAINIKATKAILDMSRECKKLQSILYCSTAFSNCPLEEIQEVVYEPYIDTKGIISIVDNTPEEVLEKITPHLLGGWPNTYAFTKAIAENTVAEFGKGLPVCIYRPSIVISTFQEPIRGWVDNMYGPTGIIAGAGVGLIRTLHCDSRVLAEMVPVDFVVNGMIAATYKNSIENNQEIPVYNYVSYTQNPITWYELMGSCGHYGSQLPSAKSVWIYSLTLHTCKYAHLLYMFFLHFLPAFVADGVCLLLGKKAQLVKAYKKIHKFSSVISYFSTKQWRFTNDNIQNLWVGLSDADKKAFNFDMTKMDWDYHSQAHCLGLRLYLINDDLSTIPQGKKLWRIFGFLHHSIKYLFCGLALYFLYGILTSILM